MNFRSFKRTTLALLTATSALFAASQASADEAVLEEPVEPAAEAPAAPAAAAPATEAPDGARFRGAIGLEGGALILPDIVNLGYAGITSQLGAQINNLVGVYAVPQLNVVFGEAGGVQIGTAIVVDFTFDDLVSVGVGPEVAAFAAIGADDTSVSGVGGALYGGRIHAAVYPALGKSDDGINRQALAIGLDLRMLAGSAGEGTVSTDGSEASATNFVFAPQVTVAYQAF